VTTRETTRQAVQQAISTRQLFDKFLRVAEASGVNYQRLWNLEQGAKPTERELALLAVALEVPVGELTEGDTK
jgi:transcriptional regulator with XRE-family HTH domain